MTDTNKLALILESTEPKNYQNSMNQHQNPKNPQNQENQNYNHQSNKNVFPHQNNNNNNNNKQKYNQTTNPSNQRNNNQSNQSSQPNSNNNNNNGGYQAKNGQGNVPQVPPNNYTNQNQMFQNNQQQYQAQNNNYGQQPNGGQGDNNNYYQKKLGQPHSNEESNYNNNMNNPNNSHQPQIQNQINNGYLPIQQQTNPSLPPNNQGQLIQAPKNHLSESYIKLDQNVDNLSSNFNQNEKRIPYDINKPQDGYNQQERGYVKHQNFNNFNNHKYERNNHFFDGSGQNPQSAYQNFSKLNPRGGYQNNNFKRNPYTYQEGSYQKRNNNYQGNQSEVQGGNEQNGNFYNNHQGFYRKQSYTKNYSQDQNYGQQNFNRNTYQPYSNFKNQYQFQQQRIQHPHSSSPTPAFQQAPQSSSSSLDQIEIQNLMDKKFQEKFDQLKDELRILIGKLNVKEGEEGQSKTLQTDKAIIQSDEHQELHKDIVELKNPDRQRQRTPKTRNQARGHGNTSQERQINRQQSNDYDDSTFNTPQNIPLKKGQQQLQTTAKLSDITFCQDNLS